MNLFIHEHLLLIIVQCIQTDAFMCMFVLARFYDIAIIAYCIFISFFILLLYLICMYWTRKNFYKKMSNSIATLDVSLEKLDMAPISKHLQKVLKTEDDAYEAKRLALEKQQAHDFDQPQACTSEEESDRLDTGLATG